MRHVFLPRGMDERTVRFLLPLTNHEGETRTEGERGRERGMLKANGITDVIAVTDDGVT